MKTPQQLTAIVKGVRINGFIVDGTEVKNRYN